MGAVYLARDLRLDRPVALKVLPAEFAGDSSLRERFLRETRTAASFSHPNIVPVHAVEERDGLLAFAMGFVEGESVAERVRRAGPLDVRSIVRLLQDIGYALAYAHGRGVVHRDIKPDNIMLERATGRALLMDFGISRSIVAKVEAQDRDAGAHPRRRSGRDGGVHEPRAGVGRRRRWAQRSLLVRPRGAVRAHGSRRDLPATRRSRFSSSS